MTTLEIQQIDDKMVVSLNRPKQHNAFNLRMISELSELFGGIEGGGGTRFVVLTGKGRTFCAGADLSMMKATVDYDFEQYAAEGRMIYDLMKVVDQCPLPVIGRINGSAIGGGVGLVSCCDIVVAVERAMFAFSEARLGLVPAIISPFVIGKIGQSNARELFLTGERFNANHASKIGLVQHVVSEETLDNVVDERVNQLRKAAPQAQTAGKALIKKVASLHNPLIIDYLVETIAERRVSAEGREGMQAFFDKRLPSWQEDENKPASTQ